jgi:hypothetical protein
MAARGELFFIAEQAQLVFHVVPAPSARRYYAAVFETLSAAPLPRVASVHRWRGPPVPPPPDASLRPSTALSLSTFVAMALLGGGILTRLRGRRRRS